MFSTSSVVPYVLLSIDLLFLVFSTWSWLFDIVRNEDYSLDNNSYKFLPFFQF